MRKEIYKVKCPKRIVFGDPMYFEEFKGAELKRLTVDYKTSKFFDAARLVLEEEPNEELPEYMERWMTLYMAPRQTIDVYVSGKIYTSQKVSDKRIGVDTARYYLNVDGRGDEIHTEIGKGRLYDAIVLNIAIPEQYDFEGMKELAGYFFEGMERIPPQKQKKQEGPSR